MKRRSFSLALPIAFASAVVLASVIGSVPAGLRAQQPGPGIGGVSNDERWTKVGELISSGLEQRNIPSVSIAASRRGRVIWEQSFGWADREKRIKASPHTVYSLASTTKPMIATALMVLVQAGRVDLDAPIERYLGRGQLTVYAGRAEDVTVRRLLHHTAGLPQHFNYFYADEPGRPRPLEETMRRFGIIIRKPGEEFCYANLGYAMIGHVIARVSGRGLPQFLRDEVYKPLGMTSAVFDPDLHHPRNIAVEYDKQGAVVPFHTCDTPGAGNGYASIHDLIRFGMFHLKDRLKDQRAFLDDGAIDRMQMEKDSTVHPGSPGESYGLGWFFRDTTSGIRMVWHEGGWTGASVMLKLLPSEDVAVAVAMNVFDTEFINRVTEETIGAVLPDYERPKGQAAARIDAAAPPSFDFPAGTYSGEIRTSEGAIPLVLEKPDGGELYAHLGDPASPAQRMRNLPAIVPRLPGEYKGSFSGHLEDPDAARYRHIIVLDLRSAGDELVGTASAMTLSGLDRPSTEDQRMRFILPYRVSLRRMSSYSARSTAPSLGPRIQE
ncbi:MAG TPA: serine hydrolase domain-containing protein [Candidatus Bathyarchaeia archaeon]|nr:serine hydrolase domain-containing protein [Candidatus Bathyarchaeia archaeon]